MSRKIGICNFKGGVGKTVIAINLAYTLSKFSEKTLLIDLDPQLNCVTGLGIAKKIILEKGQVDINNYLCLGINYKTSDMLYKYIIYDVPPKDLNITENLVKHCDMLIIPVIPDFFSLEGLAQILNFIYEKQVLYKREKDMEINIIINHYEESDFAVEICKEINNYFKDKIFFTVIPKDENIRKALNIGKPVLEYAPLSASSLGFILLSKEVRYGRGKVW